MDSTNQVQSTNSSAPTNGNFQLNSLAQSVVANQTHVTKLQSQTDAIEKQVNGLDLKFNFMLIALVICVIVVCFANARKQKPNQ